MAATAHGVLTADEVTTVEIDAGNHGLVVVNRSLEGTIWVRIDGEDPQVAGAGSYAVLGARDFAVPRRLVRRGAVTVKLLSDAARAYTVEAIA